MTRVRNLEAEREATRRWRAADPARSLWSQLKGNASTRKRVVTLEYSQFLELLKPMTCSVTGHALSWTWEGKGDNPWAPSIDRIDCSKGYEPGNVRAVCWAYNIARRNWPDSVVLEMALALTGRRSCE